MVDTEKYNTITHRIIGCAMRVHTELGNGFAEKVYQRALEIELRAEGLAFEREKETLVYYKGEIIGKRIVDFLVEGCVLVELKATTQIIDDNLNQVINYLKAFNLEVGLLINFGTKSLFFKRFVKNIPK
jgi:GxxExxY protein